MGVKAAPAWPVDNFTPVKKIPMTKSSTFTPCSEIGDFSSKILIVSAMTEDILLHS
jgi:hypothetical protein